MNIRSAIIDAVAAWLAHSYAGPVSIRSEVGKDTLTPPHAVVRVSTAAPLAPMEPVWEATVLIAVSHDVATTTAEDAESQAGDLFAKMDPQDEDGEDQLAAFIAFCDARGLAVSTMYPVDSSLTVDPHAKHWVHVLGVQIIACL